MKSSHQAPHPFRFLVVLVPFLALLLVVSSAALPARAASPNIVLSQIYGGGGNSGATFKNDFIELFNRGSVAISVTGWSVQYASTTGTSWQRTNLSGTIQPGQYYLVQEAAGTGGTTNLPTPDATGAINMSATGGKVALVNTTTTLTGSGCPFGASIVDFLGYDGANCFESAPTALLANAVAAMREGNGCVDTDNNASDFAPVTPLPHNTASPFNTCPATLPPPNLIHDIQGATHISPLNGQTVYHVPGIVTALRSNGFYYQDPNPDGDDATSEGIFVFTSSAPTVSVGDSLTINALVSEFRSGGVSSTNLTLTELTSPSIQKLSSGNPLPAPVVIGTGGRIPPTTVIENDATGDVETSGVFDPANDGIDFYESLESMLVQVNDAVAVGPRHDFGSNRETPIIGDNGANASIRTARGGIVIRANDFNPERIILNDLIVGGPTLPPSNVGDSYPGAIVGVIDYNFGNFKLEVKTLPALVSGGLPQEVTTPPPAYQLGIASFNVENLAPSDPPSKFATLANLIVNNLKAPDIVAIEEIQDNSGATDNGVVDASTTWNMLISAIQTAGGPTYQYREIDPVNDQDGGQPGGNIRQGFMFRTDRGLAFVDRPGGGSTTADSVLGSGASTQLQFSPGRVDPTNSAFNTSRKPLAGEFTFKGDKVFVIANHFNSKGGDDPLFGHLQPPTLFSEVQRLQQAAIVKNFAQALLAADPNANVVVLGDLNDFEFSNPISDLKSTPLADLMESLPQNERYSYDFDGNSQTLDQILVSNGVFGRPFFYDSVHVNSEFATQASDHDPQSANLCVDRTAPTLSVSLSRNNLWPADHNYVKVKATVNYSDNADPSPTLTLVSVTSNEPDNGLGDGDLANDIVVLDNLTFNLRAERSGTGTGRIYTITYQVTDGCGNTTTASATVTVPHDQGTNP